MTHTFTTLLVSLLLVPLSIFAQEATMDATFDDEMDFESYFEQMEEEIRQENIATSGFNAEKQEIAPTTTSAPVPSKASGSKQIYSTDDGDIVLYRQNKEVKRIPYDVPIEDANTIPDSGPRTSSSESFESEPDSATGSDPDALQVSSELTLDEDPIFSTGSTQGSGDVLPMDDAQLKPSAGGLDFLGSGMITTVVMGIALTAGGFFGLIIMKRRKLEAGLVDMPSNLSDSANIGKLESALDKIKD